MTTPDTEGLFARPDATPNRLWFRDGSKWQPTPAWQAIYEAIECFATDGDRLYTPVEAVLRTNAMELADKIEADLLAALRAIQQQGAGT